MNTGKEQHRTVFLEGFWPPLLGLIAYIAIDVSVFLIMFYRMSMDGVFGILVMEVLKVSIVLLFFALDYSYVKKAKDSIVRTEESTEERIGELERLLAQKMELQFDDLERIKRDMEAYTYTVSHELKTPIREISLYAEFVEENNGDRLMSESLEDIRSIRKTCNDMIELIQNMVAYSKSGFKIIEKKRINMHLLVYQCFEEITKALPERKIELEILELPEMTGDLLLIKQLIFNILSNSVKFTRETKNAKITVFSNVDQDTVEYGFRDNGIGFDMKYSSKIFEVFQRLHNESEYEGNGIGLATVQKIANRFGGRVEIEGKVNEGCVVRVKFPISVLSASEEHAQDENDYIKIGIIGDFTGDNASYEVGKLAAYKLTAKEINDKGGINGKQIQLLFQDDRSEIAQAKEAAILLATVKKVDLLMGSTLSTSREAIREIADRNKTLYIDNQQAEGGVASHYTFCVSAIPEQQIYKMMEYLIPRYGKRCYVIAADYNYGILTGEWGKHFINKLGGKVVGCEYIDKDRSDFTDIIDNIVDMGTDILFSVCVFQNSDIFYRQWHERGLNHIPMATTMVCAETNQHLTLEPPAMENVYVMASFIEDLDTPAAKAFVKKFRGVYNREELPYMSMETESTYTGMYLYKKAVEMAGTTEAEAVIRAFDSGGVFFDGPGGRVTIRGEDHQTIRDSVLFRIDKRHHIKEILKEKEIRSDYVEKMIEQTNGVKGGLKTLGINAPNTHYNLILNKYKN